MIKLITAFIVMINPFALFLYLEPIRTKLERKEYLYVLFRAIMISFLIYILFLFFGNFLFENLFQINFECFRIFGGIIIFSMAYNFIANGKEAMIQMKGSLDNLASEIALPFIVGAGTISITFLMMHNLGPLKSIFSIFIALSFTFLFIFLLGSIRRIIKRKKYQISFDKNMGILLRIMGFFSGAIGINMIILGIKNLIN